MTYCSAPSSPLVNDVIAMERRHLSWQRGIQDITASVFTWNHQSHFVAVTLHTGYVWTVAYDDKRSDLMQAFPQK